LEIKTLKSHFYAQLRRFFTTIAIFYLRKHAMQKNETPTKRIFYHFGENQQLALLDIPQLNGHLSNHCSSLNLSGIAERYQRHPTATTC
jgi:hypothetical protein